MYLHLRFLKIGIEMLSDPVFGGGLSLFGLVPILGTKGCSRGLGSGQNRPLPLSVLVRATQLTTLSLLTVFRTRDPRLGKCLLCHEQPSEL